MANAGYADRTTLNALLPNLDIGDVADPALRAAAFQYLYDQSDANWAYLQNLVTVGTLSPLPARFLLGQGIINGNMDVFQEGTSTTLASGSSRYVADQFKTTNLSSGVNATVSQVQVTDLVGTRFGLQIVHAGTPTNSGRLIHYYTLESKDSVMYAGQVVTLTLKVKGVQGMNVLTVAARYNATETAITNSSTLISTSLGIDIGNTSWSTMNFTFTVPSISTLTSTGVFGFEIYANKTGSAEANGDGFIITQVGLNVGSTAQIFQPRGFSVELSYCQRFFEKSYNYSVAPGSSGTTNYGLVGIAGNTDTFLSNIVYRVPKRTNPTVTLYHSDGTSDSVGKTISNIKVTGLALTGAGEKGVGFVTKSSAFTSGDVIYGHWTADARL